MNKTHGGHRYAQGNHNWHVVSPSGDDGLAMLMVDPLTLRQLQLPIKVIVFKNDALAFVELKMKAAGALVNASAELQIAAVGMSKNKSCEKRGRDGTAKSRQENRDQVRL